MKHFFLTRIPLVTTCSKMIIGPLRLILLAPFSSQVRAPGALPGLNCVDYRAASLPPIDKTKEAEEHMVFLISVGMVSRTYKACCAHNIYHNPPVGV
jgi:hypothetical protein